LAGTIEVQCDAAKGYCWCNDKGQCPCKVNGMPILLMVEGWFCIYVLIVHNTTGIKALNYLLFFFFFFFSFFFFLSSLKSLLHFIMYVGIAFSWKLSLHFMGDSIRGL
jgi:hypothetical protein